jgi:copper resistance protein C
MLEKTPRLLLCTALALLLSVNTARAHAVVVDSTPRPNETVGKAELKVAIHFNSRIDPARSRLTLVKPDGTSVVLPLDPTAPNDSLTGAASGLENGRYRLLWQTLSIDGHITHGEIPFDVSR